VCRFAWAPYRGSEELSRLVAQLSIKTLDWETVMFNARLMKALANVGSSATPSKTAEAKGKKKLGSGIGKKNLKTSNPLPKPKKKGPWAGV